MNPVCSVGLYRCVQYLNLCAASSLQWPLSAMTGKHLGRQTDAGEFNKSGAYVKIRPSFPYPVLSSLFNKKNARKKKKLSVEYKSWLDKCRSLEASCVNTDTPAGPDNQISSNSCQTTQKQPKDIVVSWPTKFPDWLSGASRTALLVRTMHHESRWSPLILKM